MNIADNLGKISSTLPQHVKLVVVSKNQQDKEMMEAYYAGYRCFGENKVQELITKQERLPADIEWHFIGHLQRNKVRQLLPAVSMIHGVDSLRLLLEIDREAARIERRIPCLLQFHIAQEESKFGFNLEESLSMLSSEEYSGCRHVCINGVMGMASYTSDQDQVHREFRLLKQIFDTLKTNYFNNDTGFREISMGMSGDYLIAMEEGSTMVRIGSAIFGER